LDAELARLGPAVAQHQDEAALRAALLTAETALTHSRSARDRANATLAQLREDTAALNATAAATRSEHDRLASLYSDRPAAVTLRAALEQAEAERDSAQGALTLARSAFSVLGGPEVQNDARRLAQAAEGLVNRLRDLRSEGDRLQGALQTMMAVGHFETKEAAEARVEQAGTDLARVERQAAAAKQLWEVLSEERRHVVERLTAPVTMRVKPYLQELFPGSTLDAGEGLDIAGLQSGNLKEPFTELSGGAQEQISLLARIGLAELLAGDGTLPLILDDALINTDPQRIQRVHRVLFRAADNLQVIVLSCHDVLFDGLGAEVIVKLEKQRH
jgi:chromosome segregation ATPase